PIELGPTEFRLLHFLMTHAERVHSRGQLLDQVWGSQVFVEDRTVDVHIRRLRRALEETGHEHLVQTVRRSTVSNVVTGLKAGVLNQQGVWIKEI
ncbi:MAG: winged helix-turn-helix domain-containing protein, partial [Sulfurimicrobium sp.]|nr:winged helix-turn-helix domain-containing protein [Sulfurimicrobium sp.]